VMVRDLAIVDDTNVVAPAVVKATTDGLYVIIADQELSLSSDAVEKSGFLLNVASTGNGETRFPVPAASFAAWLDFISVAGRTAKEERSVEEMHRILLVRGSLRLQCYATRFSVQATHHATHWDPRYLPCPAFWTHHHCEQRYIRLSSLEFRQLLYSRCRKHRSSHIRKWPHTVS
jgi:hypothetical protein